MKFDFDHAVNRRGTNSIKWNREAIEGISANPDADAFWVADMDFPTEEHIKEAARKLSEEAVFGYPKFDTLTDSFISWMERKHHVQIKPDEVVFASGLLHGIALAIRLFSNEGDGILIPSPTYRPFREMAANNARVMIDYPLGYEDGVYSFDRKRFRESAEKSRMILFCSPHNPSGLVFSREELEFVLRTAKELDIPVLSDEIHADLVHPGAVHIPMHEANRNIGAKVVTFMAPSKTFNVAGEHSSFAIFSDDRMRKSYIDLQEALRVTTPGYTIGTLSEAAYRHGLEYNEALCEYLGQNCKAIRGFLENKLPEIKMVNGEASFVTFLDCSAIYDKVKAKEEENPDVYKGGQGGGVLSRFFGVEAEVCMNDGTWFGPQYKEFVRFNYGTSRQLVLEALERMKKAVEALH